MQNANVSTVTLYKSLLLKSLEKQSLVRYLWKTLMFHTGTGVSFLRSANYSLIYLPVGVGIYGLFYGSQIFVMK